MSDLKHVRDPVTGRCVACEELNKGGPINPTYHPELAGSGLMASSNVQRPVTPVHFDPFDPNYIRAVRRGSVSLYKGQGIYAHHGNTQAKSWPSPQQVQAIEDTPNANKTQIVLVDGGGNTTRNVGVVDQPNYRIVQQPNPVIMNVSPNNTGPYTNKVEPQTIIVKQQPSPRNMPGQGMNLYGTNYYAGSQTKYGKSGGGASAGCCAGCAAGCAVCCAGCSSCCACSSCCYNARRASQGYPPKQKRKFWSVDDGDSKGRCCKSCLVGLVIFLFLLLLLAAILAAVYGTEAVNQTVPLFRRFLLTYNDTVCQTQFNSTGTTAASCGFTQSAEIVNDATFTNPPIIFNSSEATTSFILLPWISFCVVLKFITQKNS